MDIVYICLLLNVILIYINYSIVSYFASQLPGGTNNKYPRIQQRQLEGIGQRAVGSHYNGFEALTVFATGVVVAIHSGVDPYVISLFAIVQIVSRVFYMIFYLANLDILRSAVWTIGFLASMGLFVWQYISKFLK